MDKGIINAEWLATMVAGIIFNQGKAKLFNVLESQLDGGPKLHATKRITEDIIAGISQNAADLIRDTLGDWQEEVEVGPEADLTAEEVKELEDEYKQIESIIK
ncbi:hypothetical protein M7775_13640 [Sporomusa sphaeroides DSM 2875]|uniref:hypothetical protein n=1 Tax=Sporomusa sphaeroides TaxID=47679 RepID=UPI00202EFA36|nr:hypothetical protein [Sporomusa sphaeroides]MCM0759596.1 hypothetical protein [Sporomusa sphaeroides DSM 2875]